MLSIENKNADYGNFPNNSRHPELDHHWKKKSTSQIGFVSGGTLPTVPNISCSRYLCKCLLNGGDQTFLIDGKNGHRISYAETFKMVKRASRWFDQRTKLGDVVCVYSDNRPNYITTFLAATAVGATVCHVNSEFTIGELENLVTTVEGVVIIVAQKENVENAIQVVQNSSRNIQLVMFTDDNEVVPNESVTSFEREILQGWQSEELALGDQLANQSTLTSGDPKKTVLHLLTSSGTTGLPKRVMVSHSARLTNIIQLSDPNFRFCNTRKQGWGEVLTLLMPMHLMFATVLWTHALAEGAIVVTLPKFKPVLFLEALQRYHCTLLPVVPPLALFLIESPLTDHYDLSKMKKVLSGGAPMPPSMAEQLIRKFKLESYRQGYGMTEAGHVTNTLNNNYNIRSIGKLLPGTEIQIRDLQNSSILERNQLGELWIKGPQLMMGYQGLPSIFDQNGWLRTGDVGYCNESEDFYFVERLKDILKVKGHQVAPAELEQIIRKHPKVQDCAVVGLPDPRAGEYPLAFVVLKTESDERTLGPAENEEISRSIRNFVASRTCRVKHLTGGVRFVAQIPRTPSGKILRTILRRLLGE